MLRKDKNMVANYGLAKVESFGSSANSLWSMDSDIDIAVQFEPTEQSKDNGEPNQKKERRDRKDRKKNKDNKDNKDKQEDKETSVLASHFKKMDPVKALCDIRRILRPLTNGNIEGIFGAKVPILKFNHVSTGIECDLSINNTNGIPNSRLTRIYCEFDQRVHIVVKYLRNILKQAGLLQGDQGCLNSYSIILMVIAFFQSQEEPILPNLQKDNNEGSLLFYATTKNKFGKVQCKEVKYNLSESLDQVKEKFKFNNTKSVSQLVLEFLDFYFLTPKTAESRVDISKGGFTSEPTDEYSFLDIVEPFTSDARVAMGCRKSSPHPLAYQRFAFDFISAVLKS